jgi:hypothetical protein
MPRIDNEWCPKGCVKEGYYAQGEAMKRTYIRNKEKKFIGVGWYCPKCHEIFTDKDIKDGRVHKSIYPH